MPRQDGKKKRKLISGGDGKVVKKQWHVPKGFAVSAGHTDLVNQLLKGWR